MSYCVLLLTAFLVVLVCIIMTDVDDIEPESSVTASQDESLGISRFSWIPTSMKALEVAEKRLFSYLKCHLYRRYVPIHRGQSQIWTVTASSADNTETNADGEKRVPLVLIHGFGAGVGLWLSNLDALSKRRTVHAFDLLGFGRSSRVSFHKDSQIAESEWIESIEQWREQMGLDSFVLLGHSLGGFLACSYALSHPNRIRHLILADPWGFPVQPSDADQQFRLPTWARLIASVLQHFNPLASVRAAGPFGPSVVRRFRPDIGRKFSTVLDDPDDIFTYIYHCNAQSPSGETAFKSMQIPFGWAKNAMISRIGSLDANLPVTFMYGERSWMDTGAGYKVQHELRKKSPTQVQVIRGAGHHIYIDQAPVFNDMVENVCRMTDLKEEH